MPSTPAPSPQYWQVQISVPTEAVERVVALLPADEGSVSAFEDPGEKTWTVGFLLTGSGDRAEVETRLALAAGAAGVALESPRIEPLEDRDWLQSVYDSFRPIRVGRFYVHGSHVDEPPPHASLPILIDAATAFGTGEHETTRGCLMALEGLARSRPRPGRILDMGCGTGILALAAIRLWRRPVLAADIDPESVRVTRVNARVNRLAQSVRAIVSNGYGARAVRRAGPYDLILANILARPLCRMAPDLARHLAPGGRAVLAGLLNRQATQVLAAHRAQGLLLERRIVLGDWTILVLRRRPWLTTSE